MVIIPSNKEGTGFLNHCYDKKYLNGFISEKEFNGIVLICSRIAAKAYSNKQIIDRQKISEQMIMLIGLSISIAIIGLMLLIVSAIYNNNAVDTLASIFLAPAILMVFGINIYTWKKGSPEPLTFNRMVKSELDEFFKKLNDFYKSKTVQGIQFATIDGHYWLEIHLDVSKKIDEFEFGSQNFQNQSSSNLDYILSLANVSSRGKQMLLRDINKMSEVDLSDIDELEEDEEEIDPVMREGGAPEPIPEEKSEEAEKSFPNEEIDLQTVDLVKLTEMQSEIESF